MGKISRRDFVKEASVGANPSAGALASRDLELTKYACLYCTAVFDTLAALNAHVEAKHPVTEVPKEFTTFDTDVLVIGAGQAGVEAAIAAASSGAKVIIVDKKHFGRCGDSGIKSAGQMTSSWLGLDGDNPQEHLKDAVESGYWMVDQKLGLFVMQAYADDKVMLKSENYGNIHNRDVKTGEPLIMVGSGTPRPATPGLPWVDVKRRRWAGYKLYNHAYEALKLGAKVLEYCMVTNLLTDDKGAVIGATAIDFHIGEFYVIRAKSIVMATGGERQLWGAGTISALHAYGCMGLCGDGHAMAAPLGVEFRDLEFRATSVGLVGVTAICWSGGTSAGPTSTDKNGVKFMAGIPEAELTPRRIHYEVEKMLAAGGGGPHGGYFAPVASYTATSFEIPGWIAGEGIYKYIWEKKNDLDLSNQECFFNQGYNYGGIVSNEKAETGVPGLYAAGECTMHCGAGYGIFRMFSSGLVTGKWAGENGAARAKAIETPSIDYSKVIKEYNRVFGILNAKPANPLRVHEIRHKVQDAAWKGSGAILRSDKRCREALATLDSIEKDDLPRMYVADKSKICNIDWMEALETINMITMARLDTLASQTRTESRGTHLRNEYTDMDNDNWLKNVYIKMVDGKLTITTMPVIVTTIKPPLGKFPQGGGTIPGI